MTSDFCVAVHALVFLNRRQCILSSEELAQNICTNPARVRKVMARLKRAGLIETKEGAEGGYRFVLDPGAVSLRSIGDALGVHYVSSSWRSGDCDLPCLVASGMAHIMDGIFDELNELCRTHLDGMTIRHIDTLICGEHGRPAN